MFPSGFRVVLDANVLFPFTVRDTLLRAAEASLYQLHWSELILDAAAVHAGAQVIVTSNVKDFKDLPSGVEAQTPDEFLRNLFDLDPDGMIVLLREQCAAMRKRQPTFDELLGGIAKTAPDFVALIREKLGDAA